MKIMRTNLIGIVNLYIPTIVLLNAGTVPTVWYIFFHFIIGYTIFLLNAGTVLTFFHFIIGYEKNPAELQLLRKNMVIVFRN